MKNRQERTISQKSRCTEDEKTQLDANISHMKLIKNNFLSSNSFECANAHFECDWQSSGKISKFLLNFQNKDINREVKRVSYKEQNQIVFILY